MARSSATTKLAAGAVVEGLNETLKALRGIDKEADKAVRNEVQKIANMMSQEIAQAGRSRSKRDAFVANSVRGTRERTPVVKIGAATRMPVTRAGQGPRASDLMFGMEFGANQSGPNGWRFPERTPKLGRGNEGYWIYPTARRQQRRVVEMWAAALEKVAKEWGK
jgi:hypothetical protein